MRLSALPVAAVLCCAACGGDDPADVHGTYTIALTNRENGCGLTNWTEGNVAQGVMVEIGQDGSAMSADVKGLAGSALDFLLGAHVFTGSVDGASITATITGTRAMSQGACAYTYDAELTADLTGDALNGAVIYRARTNDAADCGTLTGCSSRQEFAGARPPP